MSDHADLREKLWRCWNGGLGIGGTSMAIARTAGIRIDRDTIRRYFVTFADEFRGTKP